MPPNAKQSRITIPAQDAAIAGPVVSINDKGHPRSPTLLGTGSPPSPILSNGSVRFHNTTDLGNNQLTSQSGVNNFIRTKGAGEVPPQESAKKDGKSPDAPKSPLIEGVVDRTPYAFRQANKLGANEAEDLDTSKEAVPDVAREFLQFRISVNISATIITFVIAVASSSESSVLTTAPLLWTNIIIMDTCAALALATDPAPASRDVLDREPGRKPASLFNTATRMHIIGQSMYQTFIILLFHFAGDIIFGYDESTHTELPIYEWHSELNGLVFNAFVLSQISNLISSMRIGSKKRFAGIYKNFYIIIIILVEVATQIVIASVGGVAFNLHHLSGKSWGISLALGVGSLPLGFLICLIPEEPVERILRKLALMQDSDIPQVERSENQGEGRNLSAFQTVKDDLAAFFHVGSDTTSTSSQNASR